MPGPRCMPWGGRGGICFALGPLIRMTAAVEPWGGFTAGTGECVRVCKCAVGCLGLREPVGLVVAQAIASVPGPGSWLEWTGLPAEVEAGVATISGHF